MSGLSKQVQDALDLVRREPGDPAHWAGLVLPLIASAGPRDLLALFATREQLAGDQVQVFFHGLFNDELTHNIPLQDRLILFADHMPADNPLTTVIRFFQACIELDRGDHNGLTHLADLAEKLGRQGTHFEKIPHLANLPGLMTAVPGPDALENCLQNSGPLLLPEMVWHRRAGEEGGDLIFAACDTVYLERFGRQFLNVVADLGPVHLHLTNFNDEEDRMLLDAIPAEVGVSFEDTPVAIQNSPYYASARFFRLEALMDAYQRDIVVLDIDLETLNEWPVLLAALKLGEVSFFHMPTLMPWLSHHAAVMRFSNTLRARHFAHQLANLLSHTVIDAQWFVDQLAIMVVALTHKEAINPLKLQNGYSFARYVTPAGSAAEKTDLRTGTGL